MSGLASILETLTDKLTTPIPYSNPNKPAANDKAIRKNSLKFPTNLSNTDNYYVGFDVILHRDLPNGKTYTQQKRIVAYDGPSRTAIIDDIWDTGYEPEVGDRFELVLSYPDMRVSINPAMQLTDYVTEKRYGRGLNAEKDLLLSSVTETARKCDAQSDVSLKTQTAQNVFQGSVYSLTNSAGDINWEGEVRETLASTRYINFTKVLGKITHKWNSWKVFKNGEVIYTDDNRFYRLTGTDSTKPTKPTHTSGTVNGLTHINSLNIQRTSGTGPSSIALDLSRNPVVALNADGEEISGYSLYDSDSIDYWRRLGWDEHSQSWATLYQTNFTIDTSAPLFDNVNMMLEHFNGIFSYSEGRYTLSLEEMAETVIDISEDDIIGKISFQDTGTKSAFNSVTVSYSDPGNNFEAKNISLFSKKFLKQDRNVPKKGNITVTGITNYYNVRLLADSYLKKSRFSSVINLTLFPEFIELVPGSIIAITYKRYNWFRKPFRVDTLTIHSNGTIGIVGNEYDNGFYSLTNMNKTPEIGNRNPITYTAIDAPSNLIATNTVTQNELKDGIQLTWSNAPGLQDSTAVEIFSSDTSASELTVTSSAADILTFSSPHGLKVNSKLSALNSGINITAGESYFVKTVVDPTKVTLSKVLGGATLDTANGTGLSIRFNPYSLVGTVFYPENSFLHTFPDITEFTKKYYKVRYKATK